jgi:hypothetical protein
LGPVLLPAFRPIAKSLIKGGLMAYDQGRVAWAELSERTSDMIAEAREEMEVEGPERPQERPERPKAPAAPKAGRKPAEARPH